MNYFEVPCLIILLMRCFATTYAWQREAVLDDVGLITLDWTVDVKKNVLLFEIQAKTRGYIGLGVSPNGTMARADIMVGYVDSKGDAHLKDYWASKNGNLEFEESQDWKLLTGRENDSYTMLRVRRPLHTVDRLDASIHDVPTWIIWAWHPDDPEFGKLPPYHQGRRGAKELCIITHDCYPPPVNGSPSWSTSTLHNYYPCLLSNFILGVLYLSYLG